MTLELLHDLVAAPSPSRSEGPATDVLEAWLAERRHDYVRRDRNVAAVKDSGRPGPTLLLISHHDTVPATAAWTRDPLSPEIADGKLYGLGANDAKGCVAAMASAFHRVTPRRGKLVFASVCEEEVGRGGAEVFVPTLGHVDEAIVGEPTGLRIATSQHGMLLLDCVARGRAGHAARPHLADNAIYAACRDVLALEALDVAPDTLAVTIVNAGERHNVIPDACRFTVDMRTRTPHDALVARVRATVRSEVSVRSDRFHPVATPPDARVLAAALRTGADTFDSPTLSDWAHLRGIAAIKWGPGLSEVSHTADEWVEIAMVERAAVDYARVAAEVLA
ncbi:MAG: M20/M25/M40 family metallo-hydrolase [Myxococcota bacterium]